MHTYISLSEFPGRICFISLLTFISEFIIIVLKSKENLFVQTLKSCCDKKVRFHFVTLPDDEDMGTAESMRLLKEKIQVNFYFRKCFKSSLKHNFLCNF